MAVCSDNIESFEGREKGRADLLVAARATTAAAIGGGGWGRGMELLAADSARRLREGREGGWTSRRPSEPAPRHQFGDGAPSGGLNLHRGAV